MRKVYRIDAAAAAAASVYTVRKLIDFRVHSVCRRPTRI